jgi:hypothetical protein
MFQLLVFNIIAVVDKRCSAYLTNMGKVMDKSSMRVKALEAVKSNLTRVAFKLVSMLFLYVSVEIVS